MIEIKKTIQEEIDFYESHLKHLELNKYRLCIDFVNEERTALINKIGELQNKIKIKMKTDFKLVGLSRTKSATCEPLNNENIFWPKVALTQDRFDALWDYCTQNWKDKKIAEIEHEGIYDDGTPINGILVNIREYDLKDVE